MTVDAAPEVGRFSIDGARLDLYESRFMAEPLFTSDEQQKFDAGIAELITRYPADHKGAAMLPALRLLQSMKGWLHPDGMRQVAAKLETTTTHAYEVASFYVMFFTEKPGTYVIDVCTNVPCSMRGAEGLLRYLEKRLGAEVGVNGPRYYLRETECLASCGTAPCLQINEDHYESLTKSKVDALIERLAK